MSPANKEMFCILDKWDCIALILATVDPLLSGNLLSDFLLKSHNCRKEWKIKLLLSGHHHSLTAATFWLSQRELSIVATPYLEATKFLIHNSLASR